MSETKNLHTAKFWLVMIAIIGIFLLSYPVKGDYLSFQKSGELMDRDLALTTNSKDYSVGYVQSNNNIALQYYHASVVNYLTDYTTFFGNDSWMDLGSIDHITSWGAYTTASYAGRNLLMYGCTAYNSGCTQIGTVSISGTGWHNQTLGTAQNYRYLRFANDVNVASLEITEIQINGNLPPNITSWINSYTNNASLSIAPPVGQSVIFSVTGTSQPVVSYTWTIDGVDQNNNFSSFSSSFNNLQHTVNATVTNTNGTSTPVSWVINGAAYQLPPAPPIPSGSQCGVRFDRDTQPINSIGYVLTNTSYGILDFNSYRSEVYSTKIPLLYSFDMDKSNETQTFPVLFPTSDVYTVQVVKSVPLIGDSIICSNTTQATMGPSSLFVPSVVSAGTQNNISFILGYSPNNSADTINIRIFDANGSLESIYGVSNANTVAGTQYYKNVRYLKAEQYTTQLTSSFFGILDTKISQAFLSQNNPNRTILPPSTINVSQSFYSFSDTMEYGYQIDDANYTAYSQYIAVYNWNQAVTTRIISLCGKQYNWLVHLPLVNGLVINENCDTYDLQNDGFLSGVNKLSLRGQNSTADVELAFVNFTLATTDSQGWGLSVDKNKACIGDTVRAKVIVPAGLPGRLKSGYSGLLSNVSVNNTVTFPKLMTKEGAFTFELYDDTNNLRMVQTVDVKNCVTTTPITPPSGSNANTQMQSNLNIFMASAAFWGTLIFAFVIIAVAVNKPNGSSIDLGMVGFILANVEAVAGLWAPYTIYVLIIVWMGAGIFYAVGHKTAGVD